MFESELSFPSSDSEYEIRALVWEPTTVGTSPKRPRAIIQILHGMSEHIERYRAFAEFCTEQGFIVCGHDHVGHGKSLKAPDTYGLIPKNGKDVMIADAHQLRLLMQERFASEESGSMPHLILGHSMGSFILRNYLAEHGEGLAGAIVCATGHLAPALSGAGRLLSRFLHAIKGAEHKSPLIDSMSTGAYSKQIEGAQTTHDWLSRDDAVVQAYLDDPGCGFSFTTGGNIALTTLTGDMVKRSTVEAVPKHLPLLFLAGEEDPVGEKGVAVKKAVALFEDTGHDKVTLILYPQMRHELLNEIGKEQVYSDLMNWIDEQALATDSSS